MFLLHLCLIFGYAVNHKVELLKWMRERMMYMQMIGTCEVCKRNMEGKSVILDSKNRVYCSQDYER